MDFGLEYQTKNNVKFLTSPTLREKCSILVAFTTREKGVSPPPYNTLNLDFKVGDDPKNVLKNRALVCEAFDLELEKVTTAEQVHRDGTALITPELIGQGSKNYETTIPQTDALIASLKKVPLVLFFADCVPIILVDPSNKAVGIIHAGWQGTLKEIAAKTLLEVQKNFRSRARDLLVFFGPSIGPCCYKVDKKRLEMFQKKFPEAATHPHEVDLEKATRIALENLGIYPKNFYTSKVCTSCQNNLFFSFRQEKITGRQAALVCLV